MIAEDAQPAELREVYVAVDEPGKDQATVEVRHRQVGVAQGELGEVAEVLDDAVPDHQEAITDIARCAVLMAGVLPRVVHEIEEAPADGATRRHEYFLGIRPETASRKADSTLPSAKKSGATARLVLAPLATAGCSTTRTSSPSPWCLVPMRIAGLPAATGNHRRRAHRPGAKLDGNRRVGMLGKCTQRRRAVGA